MLKYNKKFKSMNKNKFLFIIIFLIIFIGIFLIIKKKMSGNNITPSICTQELKVCADGTTVARTGPNCDFFECPISNNQQDSKVEYEDLVYDDMPVAVDGEFEKSCKSNRYNNSPLVSIRSGYVIENSQVYFYDGSKNIIVVEADPNTFECLQAYRGSKVGRFYGKDDQHVYFGTSIIEGADPDTFSFFTWEYYTKDANHVYVNGKILEGADPNTFEFLVANGAPIRYDGGSGPTKYYGQDENSKYLNEIRFDKLTFVDMGGGYVKDKDKVYFFNREIEEADPATFECVTSGIYFKDKNHVYYETAILKDADPSTFKNIGIESPYAYDQNYYYKNDTIIGNVSSTDIRVIEKLYLLNGNRLLWGDKDILINDPKSLQYVSRGYLKDSINVYSTETEPIGIIEETPPDQFKVYEFNYDNIYNSDDYFIRKGDDIVIIYNSWFDISKEELNNVDVDTFETITHPYSKDKQSVFMLASRIEGADPSTFKIIPETAYSLDKNAVYCGIKKLDEADTSTFHVQRFSDYLSFGLDNDGVYFYEDKLYGITPSGMVLERNGAVVRESDTAWYLVGGCDYAGYVPESEVEDLENYHPPCENLPEIK
jgi:hypothetical protein